MEDTQDSPPVTEEEDQAAQAMPESTVSADAEPMPDIDPAIARYVDMRMAAMRDEMVACGQIPPAPKG